MSKSGLKSKIKLAFCYANQSQKIPAKVIFEFPEPEGYAGNGIVVKALLNFLFRKGFLHPWACVAFALNYDLNKFGIEKEVGFEVKDNVLEIKKVESNDRFNVSNAR